MHSNLGNYGISFDLVEKKKPPKSKDRKRWCGGRVGRRHKPIWKLGERRTLSGKVYWRSHEYVCSGCQKHLGSAWNAYGISTKSIDEQKRALQERFRPV